MKKFKNVEKAIADFKSGKFVIVVDDKDRENEGDFIISSEKATSDDINFMISVGKGLVCIAVDQEKASKLSLSPMVQQNTGANETNFTVSVDARINTTTGISAKDRWETVQVILNEKSVPEDLSRPGHLFPIIAKSGGVLQRAGHTEACIDLCNLAGHKPTALMVEIIDEDGRMARMPSLKKIAKKYKLTLVSIAELIEYRRKKEILVQELTKIPLPSKYGDFSLRLFEDTIHGDHHVALVKGEIEKDTEVLVRVHSQCLTGDIFGSHRCDCGEQLDTALERIQSSKAGVLVYLRQEGRGIGLKNKILAYKLQDEGLDTVQANHKLGFPSDLREYGIGAQILRCCNVRKMKLLTNNPRKIVGLEGYGLIVSDREKLEIKPNKSNKDYLLTKKNKLGHLILDK
ncbi:MAG: bifunctional 3,4-dihydroxy-2-butanone-4-phosphate synthase/GTP cyclohydrolase II [bacterium TMED198]|nr:MAG: bifunctional 3,4-dihydroxy-2-butanone-4-phosphate synthase/GTP cyclohydrolase II [bacterium TMED198]